MSSPPPRQSTHFDRYVVISIATTTDEHGVYVPKDSAEVIELGWILIDAKTLQPVANDSVLVKPINTPITPLCTSLTTLTWEHVRNSGDFKDAIKRFDQFFNQYIAPNGQSPLQWAFVTLDNWDLRVQIPREARDKSCVLPMYLQHPIVFDLRTEYQRWQSYHPESLPFGSSHLQNICAALEVETVQSSAPIKHNLPFHLQALASPAPRRAMEEAETLSRVLRNLVRKSQPSAEHADVLSHPLDSSADVRAFLGERSKVLHMSGLPHDTTQSELESWFTQFGGRPIAFWTLRTPDQHKPTGTGFAVFSSHEEAAESLSMNGRALNEKAIEVSPSSGRVLDRAQDLLMPFPPSKNRPRPGDWTCPSCGFSNFQRRTACFRCSFSAVGQAPDMGFGYGYPPGAMGQYGSHGHAGGHGRHGGSIIPFRPGDWKCGAENCSYHNFAKNQSCLRCGASRAHAAIPPESGYGHGPPVESQSGFAPAAGHGPPPSYMAPGFGPGSSFQPYPSYMGSVPGGAAFSNTYPSHNGQQQASGFDQRTAEAFSSASVTPSGMPNGGFNAEATHDPFSFLPGGIGSLSLIDGDRRNGTKSPT